MFCFCRANNKSVRLSVSQNYYLFTDLFRQSNLIDLVLISFSLIKNPGDYSLKISSVTLDDDATFQCQIGAVDHVPGIRSQNAKLTVRVQPDKPVIVLGNYINAPLASQDSQVLSTTAGTKVELTCEAHGGRPEAEVCLQAFTFISIGKNHPT